MAGGGGSPAAIEAHRLTPCLTAPFVAAIETDGFRWGSTVLPDPATDAPPCCGGRRRCDDLAAAVDGAGPADTSFRACVRPRPLPATMGAVELDDT